MNPASALSGFDSLSRSRRGSSADRPRASRSVSPTNGKFTTSTKPSPARVRPIRRRRRCDLVSPRPDGGVGRTDGTAS